MYLRRTAAVLGGISGLLHLVMLIHGGLMLGLVMAAAAVACLPCAGHLWRNGSARAWATVGVMNLLMVLLHLGIIFAGSTPSGSGVGELHASSGHHHPGIPLGIPIHELFHLATALAAVEVALCLAGLVLNTKESESCQNESTGKHAARRLSAPI